MMQKVHYQYLRQCLLTFFVHKVALYAKKYAEEVKNSVASTSWAPYK